MNLSYSSVGTITKFRFACKMMWGTSANHGFYEQILKL
ncbi:hypothetical protein LEP1GSC166_2328 [Leptospira kirschneri]|nr:hypothetical protein LEP1GSC198_3893 [Leptospira kirschneri str. JB]EMK06581.1 hypothetical protein LEP1GSC166_2328 [Leptospira kirschneri]